MQKKLITSFKNANLKQNQCQRKSQLKINWFSHIIQPSKVKSDVPSLSHCTSLFTTCHEIKNAVKNLLKFKCPPIQVRNTKLKLRFSTYNSHTSHCQHSLQIHKITNKTTGDFQILIQPANSLIGNLIQIQPKWSIH